MQKNNLFKGKWLFSLIFVGALGLMVWSAPSAQAITDIIVTPGDTTVGATTSYTIVFTAEQDTPANSFINVSLTGGSWGNSLSFDISNATLDDTNTSSEIVDMAMESMGETTVLQFTTGSDIASGTEITLAVDNIINPDESGRGLTIINSMTEFGEPIEGDPENQQEASTGFTIGTVDIYGTVSNASGDPLPYMNVELYDDTGGDRDSVSTAANGEYFFVEKNSGTYFIESQSSPDSAPGQIPPAAQEVDFTSGTTEVVNIQFETGLKFLQGTVYREDGSVLTDGTAQVSINEDSGQAYFSASAGADGTYSAAVRPGIYEVSVQPGYNDQGQQRSVDWYYASGTRQLVTFADDGLSETQSLDFTVSDADATASGSVKLPDGSPANWVWVSLSSNHINMGGSTDDNGNFSFALAAGNYSLGIYSDNDSYGLAPTTVTVTAGANDLGVLTLEEKLAHIQGTVLDEDGSPLSGMNINAWSEGGWGEATTDATGAYDILVIGPSDFEVMPMIGTGSEYIYQGAPTQVSLSAATSTATGVDFSMLVSDANIQGNIVDDSGNTLSLSGWMMLFEGGEWSPNSVFSGDVMNGSFNIPVLSGKSYSVELELDDASYGLSDSVTVTTGVGTTTQNITATAADATITGHLVDPDGVVITGLSGVYVEAFSGAMGIWHENLVDSTTGAYTISVFGGRSYMIEAFIEGEITGWMSTMSMDEMTTVPVGGTVTKDITLKPAQTTLSGQVLDPSGNPVTYVWVGAFDHQNGLDTGTDVESASGYSLPLAIGEYELFVGTPPGSNYLSGEIINITIDSTSPATMTQDLNLLEGDATISGSIANLATGFSGECFAFAFANGPHADTMISQDFDIAVVGGYTYKVGAECMDGTSNKYYESENQEVTIASGETVTISLTMKDALNIPEPFAETFSATSSATIQGGNDDLIVEIKVPARAIAESGTVTITGSPTAGKSPDGSVDPAGYYWDLTATSQGREVTNFDRETTITFTHSDAWLESTELNEDDLMAVWYNDDNSIWTKPNIVHDAETNKLTTQVDHFTDFALASTVGAAAGVTAENVILTPASLGGPNVRIMDQSGVEQGNFMAYTSTLRGEFKAIGADIDNDGTKEIVTVAGSGFGPHVRAFEADGTLVADFMAYDAGFRGGLNIAMGNIDGAGGDDVIVAPMSLGGPNIRAYAYNTTTDAFELINWFMAYDSGFRGGVNIAVGNIDGSGVDEIITTPRGQGGPNIRAYTYNSTTDIFDLVSWFMGYDSAFDGGVNVTTGNVDGSGGDEVIISPMGSGGPNVRAYTYNTTTDRFSLVDWFLAYDAGFTSGVNVTTGDVDGDGDAEVITAPLSDGGPNIRAYYLNSGQFTLLDWGMAYDANQRGGVNIITADVDGDGDAEVITAPTAGSPNVRIYNWLTSQSTRTLLKWFWGFGETFRGGVNLSK